MARTLAASSPDLTRRELLSAASALSVLTLSQWPGRAWAAGADAEAFLALSRRLVGQEDLSAEIAARMLEAFAATGRMDGIAALADGTGDSDLADEIVATWYTGISPDPDALEVLTYTDALLWQALDYTKPMAFCGGGMGYWADPPAA
ncbi:MAG: ribonucleotide-diphosphate reductase subunit alpha [Rhodobacteraceae bacterium]|nr:MAG: ribonucleotide-diphosphate reductase subunit alpha [Paracoccaceae bacterium]